MRIVVLIQARMGSSRLPCKSMLSLHNLPVIDWVVHRVSKSVLAHRVVVATSTNPLDDVLITHLENRGVEIFSGPEDDVLGRLCQAAAVAEATHVIRVCADNPLIWGGEIDNLIRHFQALSEQDAAYAYNHIPRNNLYPDGLGAEMVSNALLQHLGETATLPAHREHCFSHIWDNPGQFRISTFDPPDKRLHRPDVKLDIDTPEDFRKLSLMPVNPNMPPAEVILRYPKL